MNVSLSITDGQGRILYIYLQHRVPVKRHRKDHKRQIHQARKHQQRAQVYQLHLNLHHPQRSSTRPRRSHPYVAEQHPPLQRIVSFLRPLHPSPRVPEASSALASDSCDRIWIWSVGSMSSLPARHADVRCRIHLRRATRTWMVRRRALVGRSRVRVKSRRRRLQLGSRCCCTMWRILHIRRQ